MDGDWTSPDLVALTRLMLRNRRILDRRSPIAGALTTLAGAVARRLRDNSLAGSRRHIHRHYDLGNDFFRLFLDPSLLMYSSAYFESAHDTLDQAQENKLDHICRKLLLKPGERLLDIGCGWGGLIFRAARHYGVKATGITLSEGQHQYVSEKIRELGLQDRCEVRLQDYRDIDDGPYDAVCSIEMVEAVGQDYWPTYFQTVARLLKSGGRACIQSRGRERRPAWPRRGPRCGAGPVPGS